MRIMWYPLALHLVRHLQSIAFLNERYNIGLDGVGDDTEKPTKIEVLWDSESDISSKLPNTSKIVLFADITYRTDAVDKTDAWRGQYEIQSAILASMQSWHNKVQQDLGIAAIITVPGIAASGKITTPTYLNRIVVALEWKDSGRRGIL